MLPREVDVRNVIVALEFVHDRVRPSLQGKLKVMGAAVTAFALGCMDLLAVNKDDRIMSTRLEEAVDSALTDIQGAGEGGADVFTGAPRSLSEHGRAESFARRER
jgi:hypothetical protein